jgi:hypothetical protein
MVTETIRRTLDGKDMHAHTVLFVNKKDNLVISSIQKKSQPPYVIWYIYALLIDTIRMFNYFHNVKLWKTRYD